MISPLKPCGALFAAALACTAVDAVPAERDFDQDGITLVHRFTLPARFAWGSISVSMAPQDWRVGRIDGPVATASQLRTVLGDPLSIEIGGRCAGWVDGATSYPCGFAVRGIDLGGSVGVPSIRVGADRQAAREEPPRQPEANGSGLGAAGASAPAFDTPRFVAVRVSLRDLGDRGRALGSKLDFRIRAVSNALVPSRFDLNSGMVILHGRRSDERSTSAREGACTGVERKGDT